MRKNSRNHQTQWAAQFAVASELCKRGYEVSFTLGHSAPLADLVAITPNSKTTILIDVKGLYRKNSWIVKPKATRKNLYYVLAYVPLASSNEYFVFSQQLMNRCISHELKRLGRKQSYRITGLTWRTTRLRAGSLNLLPR